MRISRLFGILLLAAASAQAEDDLLAVYRQALKNDPIIAQSRAELSATETLRAQARAVLLPQVGGAASYERTSQDFDGPGSANDDSETYPTSSIGLQLTQPLFRYAGLPLRRQANAQIASAEAQLAAAEQELVVRTADTYFGVLAAQDGLAVARANLAAIRRQLEQAEQRFEVGLIAVTDVEEARARLDLAQAQVIAAEAALASELGALEELTGQPAEGWELARLRDQIPLERPEPTDPTPWKQKAEEQNWSLQAARYLAEVAMHQVAVQRADHYPTVDLQAEYGRVNQGGGRLEGNTDSTAIGLSVNVPIYQGGLVGAQVKEAQYRYTAAREQLEQNRRAVLRLAGDAYRGVLSSIQQVQALAQALVSTQAALEATQAGFEVGTRTVVDVLNAEQLKFSAERDYQQARYDYLLNTLRLKQAAGTLAPEDLATINGWLLEAGPR